MNSEPINCLDHGYVQLLDVMGNDKAIVDAARLSISGDNVRAVSEDRGLIRYLMRMRHTTPFEMVVFKFAVKLPIFVERQWVRHRMSTTNEMSARYSELPEEFYVPEEKDIQYQATANKQGRSLSTMETALADATDFRLEAVEHFRMYKNRLRDGMARELARINLPLSTYTQKAWKVDLHNLLHFLALRLDAHAQYEIRVYAEAMASLVKQVCPIAYEAFEDFRLNAVTLSADEVRLLRSLINKAPGTTIAIAMKTRREEDEFRAKIGLFGFATEKGGES